MSNQDLKLVSVGSSFGAKERNNLRATLVTVQWLQWEALMKKSAEGLRLLCLKFPLTPSFEGAAKCLGDGLFCCRDKGNFRLPEGQRLKPRAGRFLFRNSEQLPKTLLWSLTVYPNRTVTFTSNHFYIWLCNSMLKSLSQSPDLWWAVTGRFLVNVGLAVTHLCGLKECPRKILANRTHVESKLYRH